MNELLQQFVVESRELLESAGDALEVLERSGEDRERLEAVLRDLHTLKGGAGIVAFGAMERLMHTAEDLLGARGADRHALSPARIVRCRECVDRALQWLGIMEQTGGLPEHADQQADELISRLGAPSGEAPPSASSAPEPGPWVQHIATRHPAMRARAVTAVRLIPAPDSFYRAEDPLARMMSLPELLALECAPVASWGSLDAMDPFACNLTLTALSAASSSEVIAHLQGHSGTCDIVPATSGAIQASVQSLPPVVAAVIAAQGALLGMATPEDFPGRVASAGSSAANALRFCGRTTHAQVLSRATERSLLTQSVQPLQQALADLFAATAAPDLAADFARDRLPPERLTPLTSATRTVRVDAERIEALVRLAGELTVVKNAIGHITRLATAGDRSVPHLLKDRHDTLDRLVGELRESALAMRVRPLRTVLRRFPRLVREMTAALGKSASLIIEGDDTEADTSIIEMMFEPLLHIVRNAIDHGIEIPADRIARGKPATASLKITAERRWQQVLVAVGDDGAGINLERVREVAIARGIVTEAVLHTLAESDVIDLIFAPGFSTATEITAVSGRGVGMDAVRKAVQRVGGRVTVASQAGIGTTVTLSLPFSVMMTHVMTVQAGGQMFGLPLEAVVETARVPADAITRIGSAEAIVLHHRTLPLLDLAALLGVESAHSSDTDSTVVVVAANGEWGGIRVDRVLGRLDLVLKPLDGLLEGTPGIAGTTLLGDGRVLLVLDVAEMLQ